MNVHPEEVSIPRKPPLLELRSFDLISEAFVYHNLHFNLPDLVTVFKALDFPTTFFTTEKGYVFTSQEAFIMTLYRLCEARPFVKMVETFGGEPQRLTFMYRWILRFIDHRINGLVYGDSMRRWVPSFPKFAEVIRKTIQTEFGILFQPGEFPFVSFTDCTQTKTRTPGTGPDGEGRGAKCHADAVLLDEATYTRYGKIHGLKTLNTVLPNGIIAWMYGPVSVRENDIGVLNLANLDHARKAPIGGELEEIDVDVNYAMASQRQCVEWPYGTMENLFKVLQTGATPYWRLLQKGRTSYDIPQIQLRVLHFFYNCYTAVYGGTVNAHFETPPCGLNVYLEPLLSP
eukprot:scaffold116644_cov31-Attheya_sp.AAC.1